MKGEVVNHPSIPPAEAAGRTTNGNGDIITFRLGELERRMGNIETTVNEITTTLGRIKEKLGSVATKAFVWQTLAGSMVLILTLFAHVLISQLSPGATQPPIPQN